MKIGYNKPLYVLPFDHRRSFEKGLFLNLTRDVIVAGSLRGCDI